MRVLLADDHALVRAGFRAMLAGFPGVEVVGEAGDGFQALALIAERHPDVVLMDVRMPLVGGIEATQRARQIDPRIRVVMISMYDDREVVRQAMAVGASGYVLKNADAAELRLALDRVAQGGTFLSPALGESDSAPSPPDTSPLTPRQVEVLRLIAEGHSTKATAAQLGLSVKTVETHRAMIMKRLGIHDLPGLVRYAIRTGLVSEDR